MPKFFISPENFSGHQAVITGSDVHHIRHVLRKKAGDRIIITRRIDMMSFHAQIEHISPQQIDLKILHACPQHAPLQNLHPVTLIQAIPKHAKMDFIIQKATELGVEKIIPLVSRYSFTNHEGNISPIRWKRWQKICQEAAKQCGRPNIPQLHPPAHISALPDFTVGQDLLRLLLWEEERHNRLKHVLHEQKKAHKVQVLVGPEGGFSADEIDLIRQTGFIPVSCGPWILRTETAALYSLSIIQYEFNFG
ncbi:MAG: RsmE family RNA methyltransferase [bacterium]